MMDGYSALLLASFISRNYELFQQHLETFDVEPTEAEGILKEIRALQLKHCEPHEAINR